MGKVFDASMVEEADDGTPFEIGVSGLVLVFDATDALLELRRTYDPVTGSDIEAVPFHPDHPASIPEVDTLLGLVESWIKDRGEAAAAFYSARDEPDEAPAKASGRKPPQSGKRVTNAAIMEQLTSQMLTVRQDALEKKTTNKADPLQRAPTYPTLGEQVAGRVRRPWFRGWPSSVRLQAIADHRPSPSNQTVEPNACSDRCCGYSRGTQRSFDFGRGHQSDFGCVVNALSKQSSALTALVAHISAQGDSLLNFSSGSQTSSAMKGV